MPTLIENPTRIPAASGRGEVVDEYVGRANSGEAGVSVALVRCPAGWSEPGQTPEFDEYTVVLKDMLRVAHRGGAIDVHYGQAALVRSGELVQYSTPGDGGADYVAVCPPAFSLETAHREKE